MNTTSNQNPNSAPTPTPAVSADLQNQIDLIHSELAAELLAFLQAGGNPADAVDQPVTPGGYPAFFRRHTDRLPEAIALYLSKPERVFKSDTGSDFREPPPQSLLRSVHLDEIPIEDQDQIYQRLQHMTYLDVLERLLYPPPIGLSINTSESSLRRLKHRWDTQHRVRQSSDEAKLISAAKFSDAEFNCAAQQLLRVRTLEAAMQTDTKTGELRDLFHILDRIRVTDLAERKLALTEQNASTDKTSPSHEPPKQP